MNTHPTNGFPCAADKPERSLIPSPASSLVSTEQTAARKRGCISRQAAASDHTRRAPVADSRHEHNAGVERVVGVHLLFATSETANPRDRGRRELSC